MTASINVYTFQGCVYSTSVASYPIGQPTVPYTLFRLGLFFETSCMTVGGIMINIYVVYAHGFKTPCTYWVGCIILFYTPVFMWSMTGL